MKNILYIAAKYAYDALGQLIRVNDPHENATWVYNYDRGGNITSKVKYAYTTGTLGTAVETIPYTYGDSNWKDKLTAYNGTAITYDAIGNPLNDGSWTYEWAVGRQLKKMSRDGQSLTFKYDHNGMRIQKVLEHSWYPETTNYTYHGKLLTHMEVAYTDFDEVEHTDKLHFFYDAQSRPAKVRFNGTIYTYVHNLQGDIIGILDNSGNLVVEYKYDAWGKPLSTTGSLADTLGIRNPFRYRAYVYDEESGLYYLRSRYYVSWRCVFLNADSILGIRGGILSHNAYGYCGGNPVMQEDPDGLFGNGSVHSWVCEDIVARSGGTIMRKDYQLVSLESGGYGLLDLVDPSTGEIWEVKRVSVSVSAAIRQFSAYLRGTPNEKIKAEKYIAGDYDRIPPRAFIREGYLVVYGALENGIVLYDYIDLKKVCYVSLVVLLAKLANTAAKYAARAGAKAALGGASISLCGAGIPGGVPNVGPMVQDFRVGSYNAWMSSFAFKY